MPMSATYRNALAAHGAALIRYIGLVDADGAELRGGGYARKPVTWTAPADGLVRPTADLLFDVPAGGSVGGWRGYSMTAGGSDYGGGDLTVERYADPGQYELLADKTGISHPA